MYKHIHLIKKNKIPKGIIKKRVIKTNKKVS